MRSDGVRCVLKCASEGLGCGGWISSEFGLKVGGEDDVGSGSTAEDVGASSDIGALSAAGASPWSSDGGDDTICSLARFRSGDSGVLVGDGELDSKYGRFRIGELDISGRLVEGGMGWESGITLGGVFQESDCVRRSEGVA